MRRAPLVALLFTACSKPDPEIPGALRVGVLGAPGSISPTARHGSAAMVADLLYEPLLRPTSAGLSSRFLASWRQVGARTFRLEVAPGRRFGDGTEVWPEDVAESLRGHGFETSRDGEEILAAAPGNQHPIVALLGVQVWRRVGSSTVGTRPFELVEQGPQRVALRRREPAPGRPREVVFVWAPTTRELFAMLLRGEIHVQAPLDPAQEELLDGMAAFRVVRSVAPNGLVAFFNPARLSREERAALVRALPLGEIGRIGAGPGCLAPAHRPAGPLPPGKPLSVGFLDYTEEVRRTALALRRALGARGGDLTAAGLGPGDPRLGLLVATRLVWPPAMLRESSLGGNELNAFGHVNPRFEEAIRAGDDAAADAALAEDPTLVVICRRERLAAVDARYRNATLGEWGSLETLPDWERAP